MDDLTKNLTRELEADIVAAKAATNGGARNVLTATVSAHIDVVIADFQTRIEILKKLKESL